MMALMTPVVKAFLSDNGYQCATDCMQVFGGHGYITEWGMEQFVRDARIAMSLAINRKQIHESAFLGTGEPRQSVPKKGHPYYPGDEYVDWVGVNFYSVYYHDNGPSRPCSCIRR